MLRPARHSMKAQPRDFSILAELGEVGLLDTDTIWQRHFPLDQSGQACRRRLRLLADHGLTQTIHISVASTAGLGRLPILHRLSPEGAEYLFEETGIKALRPPAARMSRSQRPYSIDSAWSKCNWLSTTPVSSHVCPRRNEFRSTTLPHRRQATPGSRSDSCSGASSQASIVPPSLAGPMQRASFPSHIRSEHGTLPCCGNLIAQQKLLNRFTRNLPGTND